MDTNAIVLLVLTEIAVKMTLMIAIRILVSTVLHAKTKLILLLVIANQVGKVNFATSTSMTVHPTLVKTVANVLTELTPFRVFVDQVITVDYVSLKLMNVIPIHAKMELSA